MGVAMVEVEMVVVEMAVEMAVEMVAVAMVVELAVVMVVVEMGVEMGVAMVVEEMVKDAQGGKPGKAPEVGVLSTVHA
jgi:hypothetical protein